MGYDKQLLFRLQSCEHSLANQGTHYKYKLARTRSLLGHQYKDIVARSWIIAQLVLACTSHGPVLHFYHSLC